MKTIKTIKIIFIILIALFVTKIAYENNQRRIKTYEMYYDYVGTEEVYIG